MQPQPYTKCVLIKITPVFVSYVLYNCTLFLCACVLFQSTFAFSFVAFLAHAQFGRRGWSMASYYDPTHVSQGGVLGCACCDSHIGRGGIASAWLKLTGVFDLRAAGIRRNNCSEGPSVTVISSRTVGLHEIQPELREWYKRGKVWWEPSLASVSVPWIVGHVLMLVVRPTFTEL